MLSSGLGSKMSEAITYVFRWRTAGDERVCPVCAPLNEREWTQQDLFQPMLFDEVSGMPIWNLDADHSLAHGDEPYNCRCHLEVEVNVSLDEVYGGLTKIIHRVDC